MALDLSSLRRAVAALQDALAVEGEVQRDRGASDRLKQTVRAGVVQHFEFTYELAWKLMKRWLVAEAGRRDAEGVSQRELFRVAAEERLLDDVSSWFEFHTARNLTSHTYNPDTAAEVARIAGAFAPAARSLLDALASRDA